jgi:hypothetical protein
VGQLLAQTSKHAYNSTGNSLQTLWILGQLQTYNCNLVGAHISNFATDGSFTIVLIICLNDAQFCPSVTLKNDNSTMSVHNYKKYFIIHLKKLYNLELLDDT